jgi:hypothetical protein
MTLWTEGRLGARLASPQNKKIIRVFFVALNGILIHDLSFPAIKFTVRVATWIGYVCCSGLCCIRCLVQVYLHVSLTARVIYFMLL